jgi:cellulose biosynthesis protein BcsQ
MNEQDENREEELKKEIEEIKISECSKDNNCHEYYDLRELQAELKGIQEGKEQAKQEILKLIIAWDKKHRKEYDYVIIEELKQMIKEQRKE